MTSQPVAPFDPDLVPDPERDPDLEPEPLPQSEDPDLGPPE